MGFISETEIKHILFLHKSKKGIMKNFYGIYLFSKIDK